MKKKQVSASPSTVAAGAVLTAESSAAKFLFQPVRHVFMFLLSCTEPLCSDHVTLILPSISISLAASDC